MHSKCKLWKFFENPIALKSLSAPGSSLITIKDDYEEKLLVDFLSIKFPGTQKIFGPDLTVNLAEQKFLTRDLFESECQVIVFNAHKIPKNTQVFLAENWNNISAQKIFFIFAAEGELLKALKKVDTVNLLQIESPAFFEFDQMLGFLLKKSGYYLAPDVLAYVLELLPSETSHLWAFVELLKTEFPNDLSSLLKIERQQIEPLLTVQKLDQFYFASLLSQKKLYKFYRELSSLELEVDIWRRALPFLSSHLRKLYNPSYTRKKSKLTRYDREILSCSKLWNEKDLMKEMNFLAQLELAAKIKPTKLEGLIRSRYFNEIIL